MYLKKLTYDLVQTDNLIINSVVNSTDDLISYKDINLNYIGCNKAFENFIGRTKEEIIGKCDFDLFDKKQATLFRNKDNQTLKDNQITISNEWITFENSKKFYFHTKEIPFDYDKTNNLGVLTISRDITDMYLAQERLKEQSYVDDLTKALNRKSFNIKIKEEFGFI